MLHGGEEGGGDFADFIPRVEFLERKGITEKQDEKDEKMKEKK